MKNSSDTIGNRTRDLPNCSAMHQPTALRRAPISVYCNKLKYCTYIYNVIEMPSIVIITYLVVLHVMLRLDCAVEVSQVRYPPYRV